jgi:hypothetical protein
VKSSVDRALASPSARSRAVPKGGRDHRGSRRLGRVEQTIWYLVAGASYIAVGVYHKWVLNWFVGPAWLVAVVVIGPWLIDKLRPRARHRRHADGSADES